MADKQELSDALGAMYGYFDLRYTGFEDLEDDFVARILAAGLDQDVEDRLSADIDEQEPLGAMFGSVEQDAIAQTIADASFGGGAAYLKQLSSYYPLVGQRIVANALPDKTLAEAIETTVVELAQPSNQNFPKIGQLAKGIGVAGVVLGLGYAAHEIYENPTGGEVLKQAVLLGAGYGIAAVAAVALAPAAGITGAAVLGAIGAGAVSYGLAANWDDIVDDVVAAKNSAISLADTIDDIIANYTAPLEGVFSETGAAIEDMVDMGQGLLDDLAGAIPAFAQPLPGWIDGPLGTFGGAKDLASPLTLDLDSDGIELTTFNAATTTTFFDIDGDGYAEQTAWVSPDDGLLARDINENGKIDDVAELFGSPTIDGFAKLALLDDNGDLIIDRYDDAWPDLVIWQDANGDAVTQDGELLSMASLGIVSIDLAGVAASTSTINGNAISHTSTFRYDNGSTDTIVDAWFVNDNVNTRYAPDYTLDEDTIFLPTLRGFGEIADLHVAASHDEDLLDLLETFASSWALSRFADASALNGDVAEILFTWAGVDGIGPQSRGPNVDARELAFLEKLFGEQWLQRGGHPNPRVDAGEQLGNAFDVVLENAKAQLLVQVGFAELYKNAISYDVFSGTIGGTFDIAQAVIDELESAASATGVDALSYWLQVARFIDVSKGIFNLTTQEQTWLDGAVTASDPLLDWADIIDGLYNTGTPDDDVLVGDSNPNTFFGFGGNDHLSGFGGDDELRGGNDDDTLEGHDGNDELYGDDGNDQLEGGNGADTLHAGSGGDFVHGGNGSDTYVYTGGDDYYSEYGTDGATGDLITLPNGIASTDLEFYRIDEDNLLITIGELGSIEIGKFFLSNTAEIETIKFHDSTTLDLTAPPNVVFYGTDGSDTLTGDDVAETIYGLSGDDELWGQGGNDILDGGVGNDVLGGYSGDDTYIFSEGFDTIVENGGDDTLVVPDGYALSDMAFSQYDDEHVNVMIAGLGQLTIVGQAVSSRIEHVRFLEDDSVVDFTDISVEVRGGDGNDVLTGTAGASLDDILNGMAGDDILFGNAGNDTYIFSQGHDQISEGSGGGVDTLLFWEAWAPADIDIYRQQSVGLGWDDLVIADQSSNKVTVESHFDFPGGAARIEYVEFSDSTVWDISAMSIETWGTSGNDSISYAGAGARIMRGFGGNDSLGGDSDNDLLDGGDGDDHLQGMGGSDTLYGDDGNDTLWGGDGGDVLDGGLGNDFLRGDGGDDLFMYSAGIDTVSDASGADILWITGGVTVNDVTITNYGFDEAKLIVAAATDEVTIADLRNPNASYHVDTVKFDDGFYANLPSYSSWLNGTSGNDIIAGNANDNTLIGFDGDDDIDAGAGSDHAHGGAGADAIHGDDGDDLLHGGDGDDVLYGDNGLDTLFGGTGSDTFTLDSASAFNDIDIIKDFDAANDDDVIDLINVLSTTSYDPQQDAITDWVEMTTVDNDTILKVDRDGTGGTYSFDQVATLKDVTGLTDEAALVSSGNLLVA